MNQYYEYAPPIFRWIFGRTSITPNQMFPWIWWGFAILTLIVFIVGNEYRKKHDKLRGRVLLIMAGIMAINIPTLDRYYRNYEFKRALKSPGIVINRQVIANNFAEINTYRLELENFAMLSELGIEGEDYWEEIDEEQCISVLGRKYPESKYRDADYREQINKAYNSGVGTSSSKQTLPDGTTKEVRWISQILGYHDGKCMQGILVKPYSRYVRIYNTGNQVGLYLFRSEVYIYDRQTGEILSRSYGFTTVATALKRRTIGLIGNTAESDSNSEVVMSDGNPVIDYRGMAGESKGYMNRLVYYTLIPERYRSDYKLNNRAHINE